VGLSDTVTVGYREADRYERARPGYPDAAVEWLAAGLRLDARTRVAELGAGTGKFTRSLAPRCGLVVAVEPVGEMRQEVARRVPAASVVGAAAEALPLRGGSVGAVVCAQSFHWFAREAAVAEIHRVLAPGGRLGLVWNQRDESVDWVAGLQAILGPHEGASPRYRNEAWRPVLERSPLVGPLRERIFDNAQEGPPEAAVERIASTSFIAALPRERREAVLEEVRRLLATHPATAGRAVLRVPYRTHAFWCERRPGPGGP
jgi:SAM-dependent methyltransferase